MNTNLPPPPVAEIDDQEDQDQGPDAAPIHATGASTGFPPVGDIKITKAANTYNTYRLELSMGQLESIRDSLEKDHANPIADELLAMFDYYLAKVPGPGEEKEDVSTREQAAGAAAEAHDEAAGEDADESPIPLPPGEKTKHDYPAPGEAEETPAEESSAEEEVERRLPAPVE